MDVHHHAHGAHEKKSWKSYAWEFMMLFLAVFCGYLAEYNLENRIERHREHKYMQSMLIDLKDDTLMIRKTIARAKELSTGLDSFQQNLYNYSFNPTFDSILYEQNFNYMQWLLPDFNDRTISQLRYSGNMRMIKNNEVADGIANYWIGVNKIMVNSKEFIDDLDRAEEAMVHIFSRKYIQTKIYDPYYGLDKFSIKANAVLMNADKKLLESYGNRVGRMTDISEHYLIPLLNNQLKEAEHLIALIGKEYHIAD